MFFDTREDYFEVMILTSYHSMNIILYSLLWFWEYFVWCLFFHFLFCWMFVIIFFEIVSNGIYFMYMNGYQQILCACLLTNSAWGAYTILFGAVLCLPCLAFIIVITLKRPCLYSHCVYCEPWVIFFLKINDSIYM